LNNEVTFRIAQKQVSHIDRNFEPNDLDDVDMVLCAIDDQAASSIIWKLCKERRVPANIADVPSECDFYFGSIHRDGQLQVMVSTNGNGPKMASMVRKQIAEALPENTGASIANVGRLRSRLRDIAPDISEGPKRMKW
jgi:precorrin-2 dehydrogenase / sirohydrochlorin ferrochelatase